MLVGIVLRKNTSVDEADSYMERGMPHTPFRVAILCYRLHFPPAVLEMCSLHFLASHDVPKNFLLFLCCVCFAACVVNVEH